MVLRAPATTQSPLLADERELVEAAQKDPGRFADLYELHFDRVYFFIVRRVADRDIAEDLTSEVFHKALANIRRFEWRDVPFGAWLLRIAANAVTDRGKRTGREIGVDVPPEIRIDADLSEVEDGARLFRLVDGLPDDQRQVVVMRFAEEKSIREIAQYFRRSEGAIKQLQFRALKNLRSVLEGGKPESRKAGNARASRNSGVRNG
jgi:RNA polymerase sigma-70 factor, ECF subfamily